MRVTAPFTAKPMCSRHSFCPGFSPSKRRRTSTQEGPASGQLSAKPSRSFRCVAADSHHDDCAHVFGEKGHIAGIPTASKCSAVGARLRYTLRNRPHEFVAVALQEIREIVARPGVQQQTVSVRQDERTQEPAEQPQRSHYASIRARLEQSLSSQPSGHHDRQEDAAEGILCGRARFVELADVVYFWALGEAYLQHPQMQSEMRRVLRRSGTGALAAGDDRLELRSRVQLLDGPFFEGQYMLGSVNFVRMADSEDEAAGASKSGASLSSSLDWAAGGLPKNYLDGVFGSDKGRMLTALEGDSPARMLRQGAARTYHTYMHWGYFQRRMAIHRSNLGEESTSGQLSAGIGSTSVSQAQSSYGASSMPWRFFENVPDQLTSMRTKEAASVADRHLRALFGDQEECITTLQAWQQMTHEAKWFGRALYDAEEVVLLGCCPGGPWSE